MNLKPPVLITIGLVAAVGAMIVLKAPRARSGAPAEAPAATSLRATAPEDSAAASSPNLAAPRGHDVPPVGEFVYLFDISGSIKGASSPSAFDEGVKLLLPTFDAIEGLDEVMPQRHRVATIGAMSLHRGALCDVYVAPHTLFTVTDTLAPVRAMRACRDSLRAAPSEPYTDISGALLYAALSLQGDRPALRGVVMVTDLDEDRGPDTKPATPNLRGLCVLAYTLVTSDAERNPALLESRQTAWRLKLTNWGARKVRIQNALSFDPADLQRFFHSCEGQ